MPTQPDSQLLMLNDLVRGRLSRRQLLARGAALGLAAPALAALLRIADARAQTPAAAPAGELTWALDSPPSNILPFGALSLAQWQGKEFLYDSLLEWDENLQVQPALAESWDTPDPTSYVFRLRQGVVFHDGAPMTAKDVKYSLDLAVAPPAPGGPVPFLGNVTGTEIVDDFTVRITTSIPDPTLPGFFAWANYTPIVPEGIYDRINVLSEGIGTGPFKLVEYVQDDVIVLEANTDYWKEGVPCVSSLTLKSLTEEQTRVASLRSGEIDGGTFSPDVIITLEGEEDISILRGLTSAPHVIHFNTVNDVPWRDARVRQAINLVCDRQVIIDNVYGGEAELTNAVPPGYGDYPLPTERLQELYATDIPRAQALMAEAGYQDGFSVELQAIAAPREYTQIAEILREQCKEINIDVTVQPLEIGQFAENIGAGTFEWASTGRGMRGDPSGYVIDFRSGTSLNKLWFGDGWKNEEIDRLYDAGLAEIDQSKRPAIYHQIQELIATDVPNLYTVQPYKYHAVRNRVSGMYVSFDNTNRGLRKVCVSADE